MTPVQCIADFQANFRPHRVPMLLLVLGFWALSAPWAVAAPSPTAGNNYFQSQVGHVETVVRGCLDADQNACADLDRTTDDMVAVVERILACAEGDGVDCPAVKQRLQTADRDPNKDPAPTPFADGKGGPMDAAAVRCMADEPEACRRLVQLTSEMVTVADGMALCRNGSQKACEIIETWYRQNAGGSPQDANYLSLAPPPSRPHADQTAAIAPESGEADPDETATAVEPPAPEAPAPEAPIPDAPATDAAAIERSLLRMELRARSECYLYGRSDICAKAQDLKTLASDLGRLRLACADGANPAACTEQQDLGTKAARTYADDIARLQQAEAASR